MNKFEKYILTIIKVIEYAFIRFKNRKLLIPIDLFPDTSSFPFALGDIVYTGHNDLKYVGSRKFLMLDKENSTKLKRGALIKNYLSNRKKNGKYIKNQFIIRNNQIINYR